MAIVHVRVVPNGKIDKVVGELATASPSRGGHGGAIKIKLRAPAIEGKANRALIVFLAEKLRVPERAISLQSGEKSRAKVIRIEQLDEQTIKDRLLSDL